MCSYEELVRTQVEAYVAAAQQYADETALSRRVAEWTSRLEPILEDQEHVCSSVNSNTHARINTLSASGL